MSVFFLGGDRITKFKLSLKLGDAGYLHCFEQDESVLNNRLESLLSLRNIITSKLGMEGNHENVCVNEPSDYPTIEHPSSQCDAIVKVIHTDWARKIPREVNEIQTALATNAIHMAMNVLTSRLTSLTKSNKIRRIKRNGKYAYTTPLRQ